MPVPLFPSSHARYADQLRERIGAVIETGRYILGPEVEAFEREFATYLGAKHAIGVANGTEAITIALRALGVGPGDEVVVPSFTFYASAEAAVRSRRTTTRSRRRFGGSASTARRTSRRSWMWVSTSG